MILNWQALCNWKISIICFGNNNSIFNLTVNSWQLPAKDRQPKIIVINAKRKLEQKNWLFYHSNYFHLMNQIFKKNIWWKRDKLESIHDMSFVSNRIVVRNDKYSAVLAELQLFCSIHVYHPIALWCMLSITRSGNCTKLRVHTIFPLPDSELSLGWWNIQSLHFVFSCHEFMFKPFVCHLIYLSWGTTLKTEIIHFYLELLWKINTVKKRKVQKID